MQDPPRVKPLPRPEQGNMGPGARVDPDGEWMSLGAAAWVVDRR